MTSSIRARSRRTARTVAFVAFATLAALACDGGSAEGDAAADGAEEPTLRTMLLHEDAENFTNASIARMAAGDYEQAQILAARATQAEPGYAPAQHALAWASLHTGDRHLQLVAGLEAVRLAPDSATYRRTLGIIFESTGRMSDAEREYRNAVRLDPGATFAWLDLARLAHRRRNYALADSAFAMVDSLAPEHFDTASADARRWSAAKAYSSTRSP